MSTAEFDYKHQSHESVGKKYAKSASSVSSNESLITRARREAGGEDDLQQMAADSAERIASGLEQVDNNLDQSIRQIEKEIQQIDQIVKSWSEGRSLRFDPSHVQPTPAENRKEEKQIDLQQKSADFFRNFLLLNTIGFFLVAMFASAQFAFQAVSPQLALAILSVVVLVVAGTNILYCSYGRAVTTPYWKDAPANKHRRPESLALKDGRLQKDG